MNISTQVFCSSCAKPMAANALACPACGAPNIANTQTSKKSKVTATLLALFLGGFGGHKFYCGYPGLGVIYILFCWTFIPAIVALIELILYICASDDETFNKKYCKQ